MHVHYCSYEGLKTTFYELQTRLTLLTGEDPLKDKHVSFIGPQVSPQKITTQLRDGMHIFMMCALVMWTLPLQ